MINKALKSNHITNVLDVSEYKVKFKFFRLLKYMIYHLIFFFLGPLIIPILWIFESKSMAENASFLPTKSGKSVFFLQYFQWLICTSINVFWLLRLLDPYQHERGEWLSEVYFETYLYHILHIFIRSFIIGVRYGFCSEMRYLMLKS